MIPHYAESGKSFERNLMLMVNRGHNSGPLSSSGRIHMCQAARNREIKSLRFRIPTQTNKSVILIPIGLSGKHQQYREHNGVCQGIIIQM